MNFGPEFEQTLNEIIKTDEENQLRAQTSEKTKLNDIKLKTNEMIEIKVFESTERVFHFSTDGHQKYNTSKPLPKLNLTKTQLKGKDLEMGFKECKQRNHLITDYPLFRGKKWHLFLKAIEDNELIDKYKPHFVSFGGPVADIMATISDTGIGWKLLAQIRDGVIYLYKTRTERVRSLSSMADSDVHNYCILNFIHTITDGYDCPLNEFEKYFDITLVQLDSHKLLTLNEINAVDDNGLPIDVKLVNCIQTSRDQMYFNRTKTLRLWSKAVTQGSSRLVIGNKTQNNFMVDCEVRNVSDIPESSQNYWSDNRCIDFLIRSLNLLKSCVKEEDIVYELVYEKGNEYLVCNQLNPKFLKAFMSEFCTKSDVKDNDIVSQTIE